MATTSVSDAVVEPQDPGTGLSDTTTPVNAAVTGVLNVHADTDFVYSGLTFQNHDGTNDTVDVGAGIAAVYDTASSTANSRGSGGNATVSSTSDSTTDTELPEDQPYLVILPTATTVSCSSGVLNRVWLHITDVTTENSVELRSDGGGGTTGEPADTALLLGSADPDDASRDVRPNDAPVEPFCILAESQMLGEPQYSLDPSDSAYQGAVNPTNNVSGYVGPFPASFDSFQVSPSGSALDVEGFGLDMYTGTAWMSDRDNNRMLEVQPSDGTILNEFDYSNETTFGNDVLWDPRDGTVWLCDYDYPGFRHYEQDGTLIESVDISSVNNSPTGIAWAVGHSDNPSFWVSDSGGMVYRYLLSDGSAPESWDSGLGTPSASGVEWRTGHIWIHDVNTDGYHLFTQDGTSIKSSTNVPDAPDGLFTDPRDGGVWHTHRGSALTTYKVNPHDEPRYYTEIDGERFLLQRGGNLE